jgi:beta-galactosidase
MIARKLTPATLCLFLVATLGSALAAPAETLSEGWRFHLGAAPGAEALSYDDTAWRELRLPHDWAIEGPFDAAAEGGTGKLPWKGEGWYRRAFSLPENDGQRVYFDFDGVMAFPQVYVNGQLAGEWDYGYNGFRVDATEWVKWGEENLLAVHVDTRKWGSRWYPGAGIYRKVGMTVTAAIHLGHWGIQVVATPKPNGPALASVKTRVENHTPGETKVTVRHEIADPSGRTVATGQASLNLGAGKEAESELELSVPDALRWDTDHPNLYTLRTTVLREGAVLDSQETRFGFRSFEFTADDGFHLNGRRVQLYGVNNHHDLGPLGGAFNRRAAQRQLEILQEMGVNALRTAHNPPAPEVLDLCDEMGIVVWDEVFDKYAWTAGRPDLEPPLPEFARRQTEALIRRDFNHPSVVTWSTGNEVWMGDEQEGVTPERMKMMADIVRELDPTRPVSHAGHIPESADGKNFADLDLMGWNYMRRYANYRKQHPDKPIIYSESASTFSTRGYYDPEFPTEKTDYSSAYQLSSYDLNAAPWSDIPDREFRYMAQDDFVAGEFVWTGFDYLGEPTPHTDQARSSFFGIVDLAGFPKDRYWLYRSHWRPDKTTVHILPHWNWPNRVGKNVPVFVYTNGDSAELFLNGESLGLRRKGEAPARTGEEDYYDVTYDYRLRWNEVAYAPGELKAVAYKNGKAIGESRVETTGAAAKLELIADREEVNADGEDLVFVTVNALDAEGRQHPLAHDLVHFTISGPAEIAAVGNGNPLSFEPFRADRRQLFYGKALLILRPLPGEGGTVTVTAVSADLEGAELAVETRPVIN